jgi:hypothetical protein
MTLTRSLGWIPPKSILASYGRSAPCWYSSRSCCRGVGGVSISNRGMTGTVTGQSGKGHRPRIGVLAQGWVRPTLGLAKAHSEILARLDGIYICYSTQGRPDVITLYYSLHIECRFSHVIEYLFIALCPEQHASICQPPLQLPQLIEQDNSNTSCGSESSDPGFNSRLGQSHNGY